MQNNCVRCVVFDWAGTTVDFGCRAPLKVFLQIFKKIGVPITIEEAQKPMGMLKIDHIRVLLSYERIKNEYFKTFNKYPDETDAVELNNMFEPELFKILPDFSDPIPHVVDTVNKLKSNGIFIGSTSGYTKEMLDIIRPISEEKGYKPDYAISSSEVKMGRPAPDMMFQNAINFNVFPMESIIKVGDTIADIKEGRNASAWSVGIIIGSSLFGCTQEELAKLNDDEVLRKKIETRGKYLEAGADYVIDDMSHLLEVIEKINLRLKNDEKPGNYHLFPKQPYLLFTPGPITTSMKVKSAMLTDWGSREQDYLELVQNVRAKLCQIACPSDLENATKIYSSVIIQGSGTFGIESCVGSAVPSNGKFLTIINGEYGQRMHKIAVLLGIKCVELVFDEMKIPDLVEIEKMLIDDTEITHVGFIHSETTTGIINPLDQICKLIKKRKKIIIVDAMSSFGGIPLDMKELDIDFLVSSSNKNLQGVPGFSFVIAKLQELENCKNNQKSVSLDLYDQWSYLERTKGGFRFTSPVHAIRALYQAILELEEEGGVSKRFKRYTRMHNILVDGMIDMNFKPIDLNGYDGPIITTFHSPKSKNYDFERFYNLLKKRRCVIYPGKLTKADTFRIGTIGYLTETDIHFLLEQIKQSIFWNNSQN